MYKYVCMYVSISTSSPSSFVSDESGAAGGGRKTGVLTGTETAPYMYK